MITHITDRERQKDALIRTLESARDEMAKRIEAQQWRPIETAPKDGTPVDLWRGERLTNMRRTELASDNVFYEPVESGYCCVRDATHWMPLPAAPQDKP